MDQDKINKNLEHTFGLASTENESHLSETKLIKRTRGPDKEPRGPYSKKSPSRGGARKGAGRPKGSGNKITPDELMSEFEKQTNMTFAQFVTKKIIEADASNNQDLVAKYLMGLSKYLIQDIQEVKTDITSNGETLGVQLNFIPTEITDWSSVPKTYKLK